MPKANPALPSDSQLFQQLSPAAFFGMKENQKQSWGLGMANTTPASEKLGKDGIRKGYEHFDLSLINTMSRNSEWKYDWATALDEILTPDHADWEQSRLIDLCFCISYIWRHGRRSIRKYFNLRDIYTNHLPFEVGYMTQVIMTKYQNMLELYEYAASLVNFKPDKDQNKNYRKGPRIKRVHLSSFQESIAKDSATVQHMCNMMHELKAKYAAKPYNPANRFEIDPSNHTSKEAESGEIKREGEEESLMQSDPDRTGKRPKIDKAYLAKKVKQSQKLVDEALEKRKKKLKEAREFYSKHGYLPTTSRTQQPMRLWSPNLDYGWSGEDEW